MLWGQDFEINVKNNGCSIYFSNEYYRTTFIDNGHLFLPLNDNVFHIDNMKKIKREDVNVEGTRSRVLGLDLETFSRSGSERLK